MTGNIIGEPSPTFLINQIKVRQAAYGSGFDSTNRTTEELLYLNNRNAWIKMASSVSITNSDLRVPLGIPDASAFSGQKLAKKAILFNGLSSLEKHSGERYDETGPQKTFNLLNQREGVNIGATAITNSDYNNAVYGLGGNQFGIQPMPGINSVQIDSKNRGSIRNATVEITAFNRFQFELIETLYLRLGFTMLIEWGWDKYLDNNGKLQKTGTTFTENGFFSSSNQDSALKRIQQYQKQYSGNYDGFFGRVVNFNWSFESDGSYKISIKLSGLGDVIESLKINNAPDQNLKNELAGIDLGSGEKKNRLGLLKESKSIIFNTKSDTKLGAELYKKLYGDGVFGDPVDNSNYFNLYKAIENDSAYNGEDFFGEGKVGKLDNRYCYYISFGELCKILEEKIIPDVNENAITQKLKQINFDLDEEKTICSYVPNLISFDPRICITNMNDEVALNQDTINNITNPTYTKYLKSFAHKIKDEANDSSLEIVYEVERNGVKVRESVYSNTMPEQGFYYDLNRKRKPLPGKYLYVKTSGIVRPGDVLYGKIYNIYLNYDMIFQSLKTNSDIKGKLTLFKFLKDICDKVNSAFGNIIDIEPIIKDDKTITFLDQKPIVGLTKKLTSFISSISQETANIQVLGFNPNSTTPEGSLLKSISFNTKLSSKLANQLSVGATARGVAVGEDSTGFSNWNRGLVDRFQQTIDDPKTTKTPTSDQTTNQDSTYSKTPITFKGEANLRAQLGRKTTKIKEATIEYKLPDYPMYQTSEWRGNSKSTTTHNGTATVTGKVDTETGILTSDLIANTSLSGYKVVYSKGTGLAYIRDQNTFGFSGDNEVARESYNGIAAAIAKAYDVNNVAKIVDAYFGDTFEEVSSDQENEIIKEELGRKRKLAELNYSSYLALMFGGRPRVSDEQEVEAGIKGDFVDTSESQYLILKGGENFSNTGKSSFKTYLDEYSAKNFGGGGSNSKSPSNQIGLIPIEFDMELDGISGFRIYNKIDINQRFLPSNYAESLEFLVKGLNHKIDSKGWSTNLQTLSTSNLNATTVRQNKGYKSRRRSKSSTAASSTTKQFQNFVGSPELQPIKDLIAQFESNGDYAIANQGDRGRYKISTTDVTTKTVNELLNKLSTTYSDKEVTDVVFAMGRYQVIPEVLKEAVTAGAVKENDLFNQQHQEQVCDYLLLSKRRKQIGKYLSGENAGTKRELELAIDGLGQEWASMPVVSKTAKSNEKVGNVVAGTGKAGYYGGDGINPTVSKTDVRTAVQKMIESRIKYSGKTPEFIPSYVTV